jgi:hypothetical protein
MRILFATAVFFFCLPLLFGQSAEEEVARLKLKASQGLVEASDRDLVEASDPNLAEGGKVVPGFFNVSLGTSYSYMKGVGSGMAFFAAPTYTLPLTDRWSLHGGIVATQYQGLNPTLSQENFYPSSFSSMSVFVAASYRMNERLVVHGTGVKQLVSAPVTPFTPYPMDNLSLGATYKLGDNFSIGATVHLNKGYGSYATPMNGYMFQPPFGW